MTGETIADADNNPIGATRRFSVGFTTELLVSWFHRHARLPDGIPFSVKRWRVLSMFSPKEFSRFFNFSMDFVRSAGLAIQGISLDIKKRISSGRFH